MKHTQRVPKVWSKTVLNFFIEKKIDVVMPTDAKCRLINVFSIIDRGDHLVSLNSSIGKIKSEKN